MTDGIAVGFVDYAKAFDRVDYRTLWNMKKSLMQVVRSLCKKKKYERNMVI